ncbi:MAG TPA: hypothetical protein VGC84_06975 [Ilumatobacteraceae bacterium]
MSDELGTQARSRGSISVVPEVITWDVCVVRVMVDAASFVVCLPGHEYRPWLARFDSGALDAELRSVASTPPRRSLRTVPRTVRHAQRGRRPRVGIEHEFEIRQGGTVVDFRRVLPHLLPGQPRVDPVDPLAVRLPFGVITADRFEAEIATEPIDLTPGFVCRAVTVAAEAQRALRQACAADHELTGYSTHISVSWNPRRDDRLSRTWARIFAPVMMLLLDCPTSPGLIVRPRPGRLELCGEYASGDQLAAAVAFAVASVRIVEEVPARSLREWFVDMTLVPALDRYGWYVDRAAFRGSDLYALGRSLRLERRSGPISAGQHFDEIIDMVLPQLEVIGNADDVASLRRARTGSLPLPLVADRMVQR